MLKGGPISREKKRLHAERRPLTHRRNSNPRTGGPLGREEAVAQIGGDEEKYEETRPLYTDRRPSMKRSGPFTNQEVI